MRYVIALALALALALAACGDDNRPLSVLVFNRETAFVHTSNPRAAAAIAHVGSSRGWNVTTSSDPAVFTAERLATTDVVVFAVTSGNVLDAMSRERLESYFRTRGGYVGIHSASYTEFDWPFYYTLVPVFFKTHPIVQPATFDVLDPDDPIVAGVPDPWLHTDELYVFYERPEHVPGLHLLLALDESQLGADYPDELRVGFHPLAFRHENAGVRSFYTALGHTDESYDEPSFLRMLAQGIEWAGARSLAMRDGE